MEKFLGLVLIAWGTFAILRRIASQDVDWAVELSPGGELLTGIFCVTQAAGIMWSGDAISPVAQCLLSVFAGCLMTACVMDLWEQVVYRFVWWPTLGASALLLLLRILREWRQYGATALTSAEGLLLYVLLQQLFFGRMYGRADSHAFCVCAVVQTALGGGFQEYLTHMTIAFLGMALIQAGRKNIASNGNLRTPVPFLPYITASFWLWVDFLAGKWYI